MGDAWLLCTHPWNEQKLDWTGLVLFRFHTFRNERDEQWLDTNRACSYMLNENILLIIQFSLPVLEEAARCIPSPCAAPPTAASHSSHKFWCLMEHPFALMLSDGFWTMFPIFQWKQEVLLNSLQRTQGHHTACHSGAFAPHGLMGGPPLVAVMCNCLQVVSILNTHFAPGFQ